MGSTLAKASKNNYSPSKLQKMGLKNTFEKAKCRSMKLGRERFVDEK